MSTITDLLSQLNASDPSQKWQSFGNGVPVEEVAPVTVPADPTSTDPTLSVAHTVNRGTGRYSITIQNAAGQQASLWLRPDPVTDGSGGVSPIQVKQSGVNDSDPSKVITDQQKLKELSWNSGGPITNVPAAAKTPSATSDLVALDSKGNEVPKGDPSAKQLRDNATGTTFNLVTDPAGTLHDVGNEVWNVKPDGTHTVVGTIPEKADHIIVPGVGVVSYDPSKPAGARTNVELAAPTDPNNLGGLQVRNGTTYVPTKDKDGKITFVEAQGLPPDTSVDHYYDDPNSRYVQLLDKQGNVIKQIDKGADWKPPVRVQPGTAPAADQVAAKIPTFNPQTGALEFTDNPNQLKASDATSELAKQLGVKVAAGSMSEKQAQDIISGAVNTMNAQTSRMTAEAAKQNADTSKATQVSTAAGDILRNASSNAQTGAGLLQNRVTTATGALNSMLGNIASSKITSIPSDFGANLVGGLSNWTTNLGGGSAVYDTAARMVQAADPKISQDPTLANQAQQTLAQMLSAYQLQTKQPHPLVQATEAANQSVQNGGVTAPVTQPVTISGTAQGQQTNVGVDQALQQQQAANALRARGLQNTPQGAAIAAGQTPVATNPPVYPGQYNTAWQQGMMSGVGMPSVGPNAANGFVAPLIPVPGQVAPYQQLQPGFVAPIAA